MKKLIISISLLFNLSYADKHTMSIEEAQLLDYGAKLYDKWFSVMPNAKKPTTTHKSYQGEKQKGNTTWRCKECHGWDYKGVKGAYSKGSHYSGIKGVEDYAGKDFNSIIKVIENDAHDFKGILGKKEINALSLFISKGQIDSSGFIDMKTKKVSADKLNGGKLYTGICASCHGHDGKKINFKEPPKETYVGDVARSNPWETLHKIRFGHPGSNMPSLFVLPKEYQINILSYIQDL